MLKQAIAILNLVGYLSFLDSQAFAVDPGPVQQIRKLQEVHDFCSNLDTVCSSLLCGLTPPDEIASLLLAQDEILAPVEGIKADLQSIIDDTKRYSDKHPAQRELQASLQQSMADVETLRLKIDAAKDARENPDIRRALLSSRLNEETTYEDLESKKTIANDQAIGVWRSQLEQIYRQITLLELQLKQNPSYAQNAQEMLETIDKKVEKFNLALRNFDNLQKMRTRNGLTLGNNKELINANVKKNTSLLKLLQGHEVSFYIISRGVDGTAPTVSMEFLTGDKLRLMITLGNGNSGTPIRKFSFAAYRLGEKLADRPILEVGSSRIINFPLPPNTDLADLLNHSDVGEFMIGERTSLHIGKVW